jgi:hypothetical protein
VKKVRKVTMKLNLMRSRRTA